MNNEYLATGFCDVDGRSNGAACKNCLSLLDSLPYYQKIKQRSYELLDLHAGISALDVGCGVGDDAFRMAAMVSPIGAVTGVDASARMIAACSSRSRDGLNIEYMQADARRLPFEDASFMRCRTDRVLQHIENPKAAIAEMARVLVPGGILLAFDNNWGTFSISGRDRKTSELMETRWGNAFVNPGIGRELKRYFCEAGLSEISECPSVSVVDDFELADQIYNLRQTASQLVDAGELSRETVSNWLADLEEQSRAGRFRCSLTAFTVVGRKR